MDHVAGTNATLIRYSRVNTQRWISLAGTLLVAASLLFVGWLVWTQRSTLGGFYTAKGDYSYLVSATVGYALSGFALARGWWWMLRALGVEDAPYPQVRGVFARSQIAKYLPGNVLHIAGRQVLGRGIGLSHAVLAFSTLLEIIGLLLSAMLVALPGIYLFGLRDFKPGLGHAAVLTLLLTGGVVLFHRILRRVAAGYEISGFRDKRRFIQRFLAALSWYMVFFTLSGCVLILVSLPVNELGGWVGALRLMLVFALSWMVGFVTPGAPSGIGVREATIILLLGEPYGNDGATLIALILRVVTVVGDLLFLALCALRRTKDDDPSV